MGRNAVMIVKSCILKEQPVFAFIEDDELRKSIVDGEGVLNAADMCW